jgi:hypothetical protein
MSSVVLQIKVPSLFHRDVLCSTREKSSTNGARIMQRRTWSRKRRFQWEQGIGNGRMTVEVYVCTHCVYARRKISILVVRNLNWNLNSDNTRRSVNNITLKIRWSGSQVWLESNCLLSPDSLCWVVATEQCAGNCSASCSNFHILYIRSRFRIFGVIYFVNPCFGVKLSSISLFFR